MKIAPATLKIAALTVVGNMEDFSGDNLDRIKSALHQAAEQCESI